MTRVKSLADLDRIRREALLKRQQAGQPGRIQVIVGLSSPSLATGGGETLKTILEFIQQHDLKNVAISQTGFLGMDSYEPIIQVKVGEQPKITYGKVDPAAARRIMQEHVLGGKVVPEFQITSK